MKAERKGGKTRIGRYKDLKFSDITVMQWSK